MEISSETLADFVPHYLPQADKQKLIEEIKKFPNLGDFSLANKPENMLQGDVWKGLTVLDFDSGEKRDIKGIILSNTCDISPTNERRTPIKLTFAPIVKISSLSKLLSNEGISSERVEGFISAIKNQLVTNYFYIPKNSKIEDDYVANFSDIHSVPLDYFLISKNTDHILSLSQSAFYFFIFKISIHFCRFNESVNRYLYT